MVTANLNGLRQYLCDKSGPVPADQTHRALNVYPFNGSQDGKIPQNSIVGIDLNTDGIIDAYIGSSPLMLEKFITRADNFPEYTAVGAWGTPVSIPQERVAKLMSQCEEWQPEISDPPPFIKLLNGVFLSVGGLSCAIVGFKAMPATLALGGPAVLGTLGVITFAAGVISLYNTVSTSIQSRQRVEDTLLQSAYHLLGFNN